MTKTNTDLDFNLTKTNANNDSFNARDQGFSELNERDDDFDSSIIMNSPSPKNNNTQKTIDMSKEASDIKHQNFDSLLDASYDM